uniref:TSA: Wollemia nobilis Ref_Wollemi_Transcript_18692_1291 transcribed RNA sequence n=1 Tax=Wollemia nobilis TaxID=56998 RepID=A0A0C9QND0_9CONI
MVTIEPADGKEEERVSPTKPTAKEEECSRKEDLSRERKDGNDAAPEAESGSGHMGGAPTTDNREAEGWETASEGENTEESPSLYSHVEEKESYEDAMTQEEQLQRSIAHANDAKTEGNRLFGAGEYEAALGQYASALEIAPDHPMANELRSMCYANRGTCYSKLGKLEETIKESTKALELNSTYMKALIRRAEAHEKLEHFEEAIADLKKVLELDGSNEQARRTIIRLEPLAAEKREKLKEEMIGKLKDLGNSVLGRFGMSVDNFKAVKDPNTGSYSISFQR